MTCCCPHARSAGRLFSWFAPSYCRRFKRRGFEPSQKQLLQGLDRAGYRDAMLLEIGCGVGHLHQTMLEQGAQHAVGVELSPRMLELAHSWAGERGLAERVRYVEGDFQQLAEQINSADVTLLDKVICCYPHAQQLVEQSAAKTKRVYAYTVPRKVWYVALGVALGRGLMWLMRTDFRPYLHDPAQIESWLHARGFTSAYQAQTAVWLTRVFTRANE